MKKFLPSFFHTYLLALLAVTFSACEKNVTVNIPEVDPKFVVEGYVETGQAPFVLLSRSLDFFGEININAALTNSVSGALVIVNDGFVTDTFAQPFPGLGFYRSNLLIGTPGRSYRLTIVAEGTTLTSTTLLPHPIPLDSVWWKEDGRRDSLGFAWAHLTDPDTVGNYYRWFAQRINRYTFGRNAGEMKDSLFIPPPGSVFEDKFINGRSFDFNVARGKTSGSSKEDDLNNENFLFKRGDTIVVKFCSIDRSVFDFWRSEETQLSNNGNPFGTVSPVNSNINGGLGVWCAYSTTFDTIYAR
jgi:hypothetical protein